MMGSVLFLLDADSAFLVWQVLIVQIDGEVFSTTPLTGQQWAACAGFGALGFVVRGLLSLIPPKSKQ